jgi:hypothetical protein
MTQIERQLIEKLEEMIAFYKLSDRTPEGDIIYYEKLFAEIVLLKKEVEKEEICFYNWRNLPAGSYKDDSGWRLPNKTFISLIDNALKVQEEKP